MKYISKKNKNELHNILKECFLNVMKSKGMINENDDYSSYNYTLLEQDFNKNKKALLSDLEYSMELINSNNIKDALSFLYKQLSWCLYISRYQNNDDNQEETNNNQEETNNNNQEETNQQEDDDANVSNQPPVQEPPVQQQEIEERGVLYAGFPYNDNTFSHVSTVRNQNSIIMIVTYNGHEGMYEVLTDNESLSTINLAITSLKPAFKLTGNYQANRPSSVKNINSGVVAYDNGKWTIEQKGKIEFN
jgi:hypothetical protein